MSFTHHVVFAVLLSATLLPATGAGEDSPTNSARVRVMFQVNDADVKDRVLPGVGIGVARTKDSEFEKTGQTDDTGRFATELEPGTWYVTYRLKYYITLNRTETVIRDPDTTVTTTLSMSVEASGLEDIQRIRIILNWGSRQDQVRDADSHVICACGEPGSHVSYQNKQHKTAAHSAELDVDDTDWGGPETITLLDPLPGVYHYWVYSFSGPPPVLAKSDVVVRVLFGDTVAGEFRVREHATGRNWRPFKDLKVDALGEPTIVPFTEAELAAKEDLSVPWPLYSGVPSTSAAPAGETPPAPPSDAESINWKRRFVAWIVGLSILFLLLRRWSK